MVLPGSSIKYEYCGGSFNDTYLLRIEEFSRSILDTFKKYQDILGTSTTTSRIKYQVQLYEYEYCGTGYEYRYINFVRAAAAGPRSSARNQRALSHSETLRRPLHFSHREQHISISMAEATVDLAELKDLVLQVLEQQKTLKESIDRIEAMAMTSAMNQSKEMKTITDGVDRLEGMAMTAATAISKLTKKQADDQSSTEAMLMQAAMNASKFEKTIGDRTENIEGMLIQQAMSVAKIGASLKPIDPEQSSGLLVRHPHA
eukprot:SAG31_NODE_534_length_14370_cov_121.217434_16_plen_259_part_00